MSKRPFDFSGTRITASQCGGRVMLNFDCLNDAAANALFMQFSEALDSGALEFVLEGEPVINENGGR